MMSYKIVINSFGNKPYNFIMGSTIIKSPSNVPAYAMSSCSDNSNTKLSKRYVLFPLLAVRLIIEPGDSSVTLSVSEFIASMPQYHFPFTSIRATSPIIIITVKSDSVYLNYSSLRIF